MSLLLNTGKQQGGRHRSGSSRGSLLSALLLLLLGSDAARAQESTSVLDLYDLSEGSGQEVDLPRVLQEISGLATTPDGRLFAHNDERAAVFELDPLTGQVTKSFMLGAMGVRGDFEGIAVAGERFFMLASDGKVLEFREGEPAAGVRFQVHDFRLDRVCEMEGLAVDPTSNTLLLPCKNTRWDGWEDRLIVLSISLDSMELVTEPRINIPLKDLDKRGLGKNFHPSSIEVHPQTGALILVAAREEAMVELTPDGEILATRELKRKDHPQPEGLAFLPDGTLILADEGQGKRGTLTRYARTQRGGGEGR